MTTNNAECGLPTASLKRRRLRVAVTVHIWCLVAVHYRSRWYVVMFVCCGGCNVSRVCVVPVFVFDTVFDVLLHLVIVVISYMCLYNFLFMCI